MANTTAPEPEETPTTTATEKASRQLLKQVGKVIDAGVGPLTGSITWAEDRLARVQGTRYEPNADLARKVRPDERDDIEKAIAWLIVESVEAASVNWFRDRAGWVHRHAGDRSGEHGGRTPLVGGMIGGAVDATTTSVVGRTAKAMFPVN
jgi:hypothetical protein